jgi:hypothetical protein
MADRKQCQTKRRKSKRKNQINIKNTSLERGERGDEGDVMERKYRHRF